MPDVTIAPSPYLKPLPLHVPEVYQLYTRIVDAEAYVHVNRIRYSAPYRLIGRALEVRETLERIDLYEGPRRVATHARAYGPRDIRVTDPAHRRALADAASTLGPVALLVNNASTLGATPLPHLRDIDADVLRRVFDVNVVAPIALVQDLDHQWANDATVVNVSSDAAVAAYEGWGGYGSSKAALEHASRVLAEERPDLRVLIVDPGDMRTEMHQDAFPGEDITDRPPPDVSVPGLMAVAWPRTDQLSAGDHTTWPLTLA